MHPPSSFGFGGAQSHWCQTHSTRAHSDTATRRAMRGGEESKERGNGYIERRKIQNLGTRTEPGSTDPKGRGPTVPAVLEQPIKRRGRTRWRWQEACQRMGFKARFWPAYKQPERLTVLKMKRVRRRSKSGCKGT